jgi:peroxiredoxin
VNVDGSSQNGWYEVKGSTPMTQLTDLNNLVQAFSNEVNQLDEEYRDAYSKKEEKKMEDLRAQFTKKQGEINLMIRQKIRAMGTSLALIQAVNYLDMDNDFPFIDSVANVVDSNIPDYQIKRDFINKIRQLRALSVGSMAPEIELPDPEGNIIKLSSLRGKYVLVDFWAAWCGPCRREMPNVVKMYQKYGGKDFEVLGVSLDRKKDDWVKAIKEDGITWKQVSDLKYFNSKAARDYEINAIPATYLLDKDGKIIGKNLRGKTLEDKLAEIFGS